MLLKQKDFKFEVFSADGDSGELFLATRKTDGKKFVVKHAFSDCACNEFLYYSLAKELGLKTLEFYLFEKDSKRAGFKSGYAIAIEYIDCAKRLSDIAAQKRTEIKNWREYFYHRALFAAFIEEDGAEFIIDKDNYLYRIDTTESFGINYFIIGAITTQAAQQTAYRMSADREERVCVKLCEQGNLIKETYTETDYKIFCEAIERLSEMDIEQIEQIVEELCMVYPKELMSYYMNFFISCQDACEKYLQTVSK